MADAPEVYGYDDIEVAWTGDQQVPLIDIDLHTTQGRPSLMDSTVAARVSLTPGEAVALSQALLVQVERVYRKG